MRKEMNHSRHKFLFRRILAGLLVLSAATLLAASLLAHTDEDWTLSDEDQTGSPYQLPNEAAALPVVLHFVPGLHFIGLHAFEPTELFLPLSVTPAASSRAPPILS